jgi:PAS domain S-box-containing protein
MDERSINEYRERESQLLKAHEKSLHDLKTSEEKYKSIVNNSPLGMHHYELKDDGRLIFIDANPAADAMLGFKHEPLYGLPIEEAFPGHAAGTGSKVPQLYKDICLGKLPLQIQQVNYKDKTNNIDGIFEIYAFQTSKNHCTVKFLDITKQEQEKKLLEKSLKEKEVLLQEVHHRVKNNLQITVSLLNLQMDRFEDPAIVAAFSDAISRLQVMALSHQSLYQSRDFSKLDMRKFIAEIVDAVIYLGSPDTLTPVEYHLADCSLTLDKAIPCGLIINELLTNTLKHAFPSGQAWDPKVIIKSAIHGNIVEISVEDNGIGAKTFSTDPGLGMMLIDSLVHQLKGSIEYHRNGGTRSTLRIPLNDEVK